VSESRDQRTDDTRPSPDGDSVAGTIAVDSPANETEWEAPAMAPDRRPDRRESGPAVAETMVAGSQGVDETVDTPSPSLLETLEISSLDGWKKASGSSATGAGSGAAEFLADSPGNAKTNEATEGPGLATGRRSAALLRSRPVGLVVPGYEIIAEIGRGGMGVVYKARHVRLNRLVALKMILAGAHASAEQIARFQIEARAVAQIQHPGIVQIHEDGDHEGLPYFSLEFVAGISLAQSIGGKPQPPRSAATMVMALCRAMAEAHARGIVRPGQTDGR
jgi:hypothetical protein